MLQIRRADVALVIAKWCIPFIIPLLFVHGVLNVNYPADYRLLNLVPWRMGGFQYGISISLNVVLFAVVAAFWLHTRRDEFVEALIRLRLPLWAILFSSQSVAVGAIVERRVSKIYLAQRARGIRVGPSVLARVKAFPSVLVPAAVGTLLEAEGRIPSLVSRGFGCGPMAPLPNPPVDSLQRLWTATPILLLLAVWLLQAGA
jgi:energy-coupling factor transporter transmembrane protein EcfT